MALKHGEYDLVSYFDPNTEKYVCPCGSKFKYKKHFRYHRTHNCKRKFICPYCSHSVTTKTILSQHMALVHWDLMNPGTASFDDVKNESFVEEYSNDHDNNDTNVALG